MLKKDLGHLLVGLKLFLQCHSLVAELGYLNVNETKNFPSESEAEAALPTQGTFG